jgi:FkbM family methyltransferase
MQKLVRPLRLSLNGNPVYYRTGSDDLVVINDLLLREEFGCGAQDVQAPKLIVDCGAYAGYSTLYFLTKYKDAHVIAVEPDDRNLELCLLNLEPYANRVTLTHAAIWPESVGLTVRKGAHTGSSSEWATMVAPVENGAEPDVMGITLHDLLRDSGFAAIDLLKTNMPHQYEIFSQNQNAWLPHVRNIVVRLHDQKDGDAFFSAMAASQFFLTRWPTALACTRIEPAGTTKASPGGTIPVNGGFEDMRVAAAQVVPGGWIRGSADPAAGWSTVVCDPQLRVSLAVRTGLQHSGGNALCVRANAGARIPPRSAPYAAIENETALPVSEGETWNVRAFVKTLAGAAPPDGMVRGAYIFLRLLYEADTYTDVPMRPIFDVTGEYVERAETLRIPKSPPGKRIERATLWLYVWLENSTAEEIAVENGQWDVFFDDISCARA